METAYHVLLVAYLGIVFCTDASDVCVHNDMQFAHWAPDEGWNSCIGEYRTTALFTEILHLDTWQKMCSAAASLDKCISDEFGQCNETSRHYLMTQARVYLLNTGRNQWYPASVDSTIRDVCQGNSIKDEILLLFDRPGMAGCVDEKLEGSIETCAQGWFTEMRAVWGVDWDTLGQPRTDSLHRYARSTFKCVLKTAWQHPNCSDDVVKWLMYAINLTLPEQMRPRYPSDQIGKPLSEMDTLSTVRDTVGVWGDPHLLMYDVISPVTCSSEGSQVYLSNSFIEITGQNQKMDSSGATVLTKLEINFKRSNGRTYGGYVAEGGSLPSHFMSLPDHTQLGQNSRLIDITTIKQNTKILLNSTTRAFQMLIQRRGNEYFFSLRVGRGVLDSSGGLLVTGCSYSNGDVLNTSSGVSGDDRKHSVPLGVSEQECEDACATLNSTCGLLDLKLTTQACVFDCRIAGDLKYAEIARSFVADVEELTARDDDLTLIPTPPTSGERLDSVAAPLCASLALVVTLALVHSHV